MSNDYWTINEDRTEPHWLVLSDVRFADTKIWPKWKMVIKWDGCCHLHEDAPEYMGDSGNGYWHFCGVQAIDEMIARLQEAKCKALEHFGEGWVQEDDE